MFSELSKVRLNDKCDLSKLIEDRFIKDSRTMDIIGRPMHFNFNPKDPFNCVNESEIKVCFEFIFLY